MDDPAYYPSIIDPCLTANVDWQQRRDPRPLKIGNQKKSHI
jgi:hypothetical protein